MLEEAVDPPQRKVKLSFYLFVLHLLNTQSSWFLKVKVKFKANFTISQGIIQNEVNFSVCSEGPGQNCAQFRSFRFLLFEKKMESMSKKK